MPGTPSCSVIWLALLRPVAAPDCSSTPLVSAAFYVLPSSGSPSAPPLPKFVTCIAPRFSFRPSRYEKSCTRLWPTNRLTIAASMSARLSGLAIVVGSHLLACQASVNAGAYSRVGLTGGRNGPPGVSELDACALLVRALLPIVVKVGRPVTASTSYANGLASK